jgi:anti-sigma regulatory factor (Ser/Thr protein kinase)
MTIMAGDDVRLIVDRELPPVLESVPYARDLAVHDVDVAIRRDVELVVSELVANAVKHGSGPIRLVVEVQGESVCIAVRDAGPLPDGADGHGYGLRIVERVAVATGVDRHDQGKTIWAQLDAPAA